MLARRFSRLATVAVVRRPALWRFFRRPLRRQFDALAPRWDKLRQPDHLRPLERALEEVAPEPRRVLDLGAGTGDGSVAIARRFGGAQVVGVDLAPAMIERARRELPAELDGRVRFEVEDASALPYADSSFDLVVHVNMIPFFDELTRLIAPDGSALFAFSGGAGTPIYVPFDRLRRALEQRGFEQFATFSTGRGAALLARKAGRS